jgi:hypothetical protein
MLLGSCSSTTAAANTNGTTNAYTTAYKSVTWASGITVSFPSSCSMTVTGSGTPYQHQAYYLVPVSNGGTVVATTASGIQLMVSPYAGSGLSTSIKSVSATFNICPTKATSTTSAGMGAIGLITEGNALFNPYEATGTVALSDNASYTFASTACGGTTCTAAFLDPCNQHTTGGTGGSTWHFHGTPTCWTSTIDGSSGPSHIIGIALDGFPIYGGRDINGNVIDPTTLDACNGITSVTPEFTTAAYHYVLPITANGTAVTTKQSSINCYAGTVNATLSAQMEKLACKMPMLLASGKMRLPDGREVTPAEADVWMQKAMPGMQMAGISRSTPASNTASARQGPMHMAGM